MAASNGGGGRRMQKVTPIKAQRGGSQAAASGKPPLNTGRKRITDAYDGVVSEQFRGGKDGLPYSGA